MIHLTHLLFAFAMVLLICNFHFPCLHFSLSPETLLFVFLGALAPDVDHPSSYINKKSWRLFSLSALTTHRSWTHSLIGSLTFTFLIYIIARNLGFPFLWACFFIGYVSHLLLDSLNPSGVTWLWPKRKRYGLNFIKTGSTGEILFQLTLTGMILILGYHYYYLN